MFGLLKMAVCHTPRVKLYRVYHTSIIVLTVETVNANIGYGYTSAGMWLHDQLYALVQDETKCTTVVD